MHDGMLSEQIQEMQAYHARIKPGLLKPARGILRHPYLSAGLGDSYPDLTDWDSIWSGMGYLAAGDPDPLRFTLLNLLEHLLPDGKGQRRIGYRIYSAPAYQTRPFLVSGCYALSQSIGVDWLPERGLEALECHLNYWHIHRTGREGLLKWLDVDEGFADNGMANFTWERNCVQGCDLNAQLVREHLALAHLFRESGREDDARRQEDRAERLCQRINACMWDEEDGFYYSLYNPPHRHDPSRFIRIKAYNNLWPLWVGIAPLERAQRVIQNHLLNPEVFRSPHGIRSLSKEDRFYHNLPYGTNLPMYGTPMTGLMMDSWCSNWQGPLWAVPNWLSVMALKRYGFTEEAEQLTQDYIGLLATQLKQNGGYHENYHGDTGEPVRTLGLGSWYVLMPEVISADDSAFFPGLNHMTETV